MDGSNLIFIVMLIVIPICLFTGVARTLIPGCHSPRRLWDADQPGRTRQRPDPDQATSDPRGSEIPAAHAA
jgi:hypothetical protein